MLYKKTNNNIPPILNKIIDFIALLRRVDFLTPQDKSVLCNYIKLFCYNRNFFEINIDKEIDEYLARLIDLCDKLDGLNLNTTTTRSAGSNLYGFLYLLSDYSILLGEAGFTPSEINKRVRSIVIDRLLLNDDTTIFIGFCEIIIREIERIIAVPDNMSLGIHSQDITYENIINLYHYIIRNYEGYLHSHRVAISNPESDEYKKKEKLKQQIYFLRVLVSAYAEKTTGYAESIFSIPMTDPLLSPATTIQTNQNPVVINSLQGERLLSFPSPEKIASQEQSQSLVYGTPPDSLRQSSPQSSQYFGTPTRSPQSQEEITTPTSSSDFRTAILLPETLDKYIMSPNDCNDIETIPTQISTVQSSERRSPRIAARVQIAQQQQQPNIVVQRNNNTFYQGNYLGKSEDDENSSTISILGNIYSVDNSRISAYKPNNTYIFSSENPNNEKIKQELSTRLHSGGKRRTMKKRIKRNIKTKHKRKNKTQRKKQNKTKRLQLR
jgi:hypothetical protein